jgi:hypothetical protein
MAKPLTGSIRKNDKGDNPKRPDYRGSYTHEDCPSCGAAGGNYWVSSYINTDRDTGEKYLSIGMKPKEDKAPTPVQEPAQSVEDEDAIPF